MRSTPIKHPPTNTLDLITGRTGWSAIPAILALDATAVQDFTRESGYVYQTDRAGLLAAMQAGHEAQTALSDAAQVLGVTMAYVDLAELSECDARAGSWLACGLAELKRVIDDAVAGMATALAHGDHLMDSQEDQDATS